jgi:hypothetical protein
MMYPHERSLVKRLKGKPFVIIGVNSDTDVDSARAAIVQQQISWKSFWDGEEGKGGPISSTWLVRTWPTLYLLDGKGVIRSKWVGAPEPKSLQERITTLLKELGEEVDLANEDAELSTAPH